MAASFQLKKSGSDKFMFNLKAGNGEVILTSEIYNAKADALNGIESVRTNSVIDERYERKTASNGSPFFVLKAANGQMIGKSEMYSGNTAMNNGIDSVKRNGPVAVLSDETAAA